MSARTRQRPRAQYSSLDEALELFATIADANGEPYRALAYRRALAYHRTAASSSAQGREIDDKIEEYRATGRIRELDILAAAPTTRAMLDLTSIFGIGPSSAREFVSRGINSRAELERAAARRIVKLSRAQQLGLRHYDDLRRRIPRADVSRVSEIIFAHIIAAARDVFGDAESRALRIETAGSYRRREPESRDVDILVARALPATREIARDISPDDAAPSDEATHDSSEDRAFMREIHARVQGDPAFVDVIALGGQKYSFLYRFRWVIAVDVFYVPARSFYAALLYATGSQLFNIWMRERCKERGYSLNQYGMTAPDGEMIYLDSEARAFELIGVAFIPPRDRTRVPRVT
jgi:DNA polymerase/3'-5' exonuclease PolX